MRILYLSNASFPSEITHTLSMLRVCRLFSEHGHRVLLTGLRARPLTDAEIFAYYGMESTFELALTSMPRWLDNRYARKLTLDRLYLAWRFRQALKAFAPDLVYSRLTLIELLAVPRSTPLVYEMHSPGALTGTRWERALFTTLAHRKQLRHIVVTTEALREYLATELPGIPVKVARLSAESPAAIAPEALDRFRAETLQGQAFSFHAGYTGYLNGIRGIEVMLETARLTPEIAFHIVGGPPEAVREWQAFARDRQAGENVFFYGHRAASEIPLFLNCFDAFLSPLQKPKRPLTAMSPLKVPQYLAYGKPLIASDVLPHREQLTDGEHALLVPADDPRAWAAALHRLEEDPALRARLAANARSYYERELTPARRIEKLLDGIDA